MKKILFGILFILFLLPLGVKAVETTDQFYIDIKIEENGDLKVRELARISGTYNGRFRTLEYKGPSSKTFVGDEDSFYSSDIYNGSDITDIKVGAIKANTITWDLFDKPYVSFEQAEYASAGEYGKYTLSGDSTIMIKMFMPSSYASVFYLEYTVKDVVVVHNDVAEINWNLLGDSYEENIDDFQARVTLPKDDSDLRVWLKGSEKTLNGVIKKTNDHQADVSFDFLGAYNPITVRLMFNKSQTPNATKTSGVDGKEKILAVEKKNAEQANAWRNKLQKQNKIIKGVNILWFAAFIISIIVFYFKYDKEYKPEFMHEYMRDLPSDISPEVVEYIMKKKSTSNGFAASICNIIHKKAFTVEEDPNKKKNYIITADETKFDRLTDDEKIIYDLLITTVGNGKSVTTKELKDYGKKESHATSFLNKFSKWKRSVDKKGKELNIYESITAGKALIVLLGLASIGLFMLDLSMEVWIGAGFLFGILGSIGIIYVSLAKRKTKTGIEEYTKWKAFKKFLIDFGRFDEKELPEIALWEKYLVYATALGCAKEVQKAMQVKINEMYPNGIDKTNPTFADYYYMNRIIDMNMASTVSNTVNTAISASRSALASSAASSAGGFGGGSSFGGGSGGGGGGGGRF